MSTVQCWGVGFWDHKPATESSLGIGGLLWDHLIGWYLQPCQSFGVAPKVYTPAVDALGKMGFWGELHMKPSLLALTDFLMCHFESWRPQVINRKDDAWRMNTSRSTVISLSRDSYSAGMHCFKKKNPEAQASQIGKIKGGGKVHYHLKIVLC